MAVDPKLLSDEEVFGGSTPATPATPAAPSLLSDADVFGAAPQKKWDPQFEAAVKQEEGYTPTPKWDYKQYSVGFGTRYRRGDPNTPEFHQQRFDEEMSQAADTVDRFKPNLPVGVRKGLMDLTYNAGDSWTQKGLGQAIQAENYPMAAAHFLEYNKAGGQPNDVLMRRRSRFAPGFMEGTQVAAATGPGLMSDEEVFGLGTPATPVAPPSNAAGAFPSSSTVSLGGMEGQVPSTAPAPAVSPAQPTEGPGAFSRGLVNTLMKQNPEALATTLEAVGRMQPDMAQTVAPWAEKLREFAKLSPEEYAPRAKDFFTSIQGGLGPLSTFLGEGLGQVAGSAVPGLVTGGAGAAIGGAAGSVVPGVGTAAGAVGGGVVGGLASAAPLNFADAHDTLIQEGLDVAAADKAAAWMTPLLTALDYPMIGQVAGAFTREAKKEVVRGVARRILSEAGKGMTKEGVTEAMQEAIPLVEASRQTGSPLVTPERASQVVGAGVIGAMGGAIGGGVSGIPKDAAPVTAPPTEAEVDTAHHGMLTREPQAAPVTIVAPPTTIEGVPFSQPEGAVASRTPLTTSTFYSTLKRMATEKLPEAGTPEQFLATLRGRVKEEELADTGVLEWMKQQGPKVKKQDLLEHLYDRAIQLDETIYADAATVEEGEKTPGQYQAYKTPGPIDAYRVIVMHMPEKLPGASPMQARREGVDYVSPHYSEPNIIATARLTHRTDTTGVPVVHVEEIQSDAHQEGAKKGYKKISDTELETAHKRFMYVAGVVRGLWNSVPMGNRQDGVSRSAWLRENSPEYTALNEEYAQLADTIARAQNKVPDLPFKKSWDDLAIKRLIRWAADKGISRITLAPGSEQTRRYPDMAITRNAANVQGLETYYDKVLQNKMKAAAKRLGGTWGETQIYTEGGTQPRAVDRLQNPYLGRPQRVFYIDIPEAARTQVQTEGLPLYSDLDNGPKVDTREKITVAVRTGLKGHSLFNPAVRGIQAVVEVARLMGIESKVRFAIIAEKGTPYGYVNSRTPDVTGRWTITINLAEHVRETDLWSTLTHEFGHVVVFEKWEKSSNETKAAIHAAFKKWREENNTNTPYYQMIRGRDSLNSPRMVKALQNMNSTAKMQSPDYWLSFEEFLAESIARWASTDQVATTIADRFLQGIARVLKKMHETVYEKLGMIYRPAPAIAEWMNSMVRSGVDMASVGEEWLQRTREDNQRQIDKDSPQVVAVPQQTETTAARRALDKLFKGNPPEQLLRDAAHADRFNWLYKWGLSLVQVAKRNWWIKELQAYREDVQQMHLEIQKIMAAAHYVMKQLRDLGRAQEEAVYGAMDDLDQQRYRTQKEIDDGVSRNPTREEFNEVVRRRGVSSDGLKALNNMRKMFDDFLTLNEQSAIELAQRTIQDPVKLSEVLDGIRANFREMRQRPYFPHLQFGDYTLTIRDAAGKVIHHESHERRGLRSGRQVRDERVRELTPLLENGETIQAGVWEKDVRPVVGMPKGLLDLMAEKLDLSDTQRDALDQLRYAAAPQNSFRHRFQRRKNISGYSMDFRRAFATYFFHGAHFYGKAKYMDRLIGHIKALKDSTKAVDATGELLYPDATKRLQIVNFLHDHRQNILDVKGDWAALRALTFVWALGYSASAAALNTTQLLVGTYPFLAAQFGDARTVAAMTKAGTKLTTYYKKGTLQGTSDADLRALDEAIKDGTITEAMAPQLAATAQGNNLFYGMAGNTLQRGWQHFMEKAAFLFEMTEQFNRRITFRAAWDLALANPNAAYVEKAVKENAAKMARLTGPAHQGGLGWSEAQARAYVAAKDATETTQYVYAQYARPRFMRGKLGTVFMFKMFVQNTLFMLVNYPSTAWRSILVMGALGGFMGLPGGDDVKEIIRVIAWQLFGKDFNLEKEARRMILNMSDGKIPPDMILHGLARRGMGIPAVLDLMGNTANFGSLDATAERFQIGRSAKPHVPVPIFDWSKSVGMGNILPVQLGELLGPPNKDQSKAMADQIQRASGAAFGLGFNMYKALTDTGLEASDPKRWERTIPRAFGAVSRAFRTGVEGRERTRTGATLQNYDAHDTEQMAELIGMGLGFQPLRSTAQWDRIIAEREAQEFWDISRSTLLEQYAKAVRSKSQPDIEKVRESIKKFNVELPQSAKGKAIGGDTIKQSLLGKARTIQAQESGTPLQKRAIGTARDIQDLFPESTVDVRRVR